MKNNKKMKTLAAVLTIALTAGCMGTAMPLRVLAEEENQAETIKEWTAKEDYEKWYYGGKDWEYQYSGGANSALAYDETVDALKLTVDYSQDTAQTWSQAAACYWEDNMDLTGASQVEFDFLFDQAKLTQGSFQVKVYSNCGVDTYVPIDTGAAEAFDDTLSKVHVVVPFETPVAAASGDLAICLIGCETSYSGDVYMKDVKVSGAKMEAEDVAVDSTVEVKDATALTAEELTFPAEVTLADGNATAEAKAVYAYLEGIGKSEYVIFGQQNATWHKAGSPELGSSDSMDVTGSNPGIIGMDTLSLVGDEYSAGRYNAEIVPETGEEALPEDVDGNIQAAANIANMALKEGAILTLSSHMPNFSVVAEREDYQEGQPSYMKYDFTGYTPNELSGDVANQLLPGGEYNEKYNAFLDMIAAYAEKVNGAILFRPFHENTGSWFWWGAAFCEPSTYKNVYRYTVEYLRDTKNIHNLLYVYGPGSEAATVEEYGIRYPGDAYVDMVGFDMYNNAPGADNSAWYESMKNELQVVESFAKEHKKLVAVTETGISNEAQQGENQTALLKKDNQAKDWYNEVMKVLSETEASYFLLWADFGKKDGYYIPYVDAVNEDGTLHGHELLDDFIRFYNEKDSVFAGNQKEILSGVNGEEIKAVPAAEGAIGYVTSPVSGRRILEPVILQAKVTGAKESAAVQFVLHGAEEVTLDGAADGALYSAELTAEDLEKLGETVGTIDLVIDGAVNDSVNAIFNIPEPEEDPYEIDDFETYFGEESLLNCAWTTNKATGSEITLSVADKSEKALSGEAALKFVYNETSDGWAGATISKEVDWSDCNALQFYTIPDGKNQKVVIQLTANNTCYEVYLNTYPEYAQDTDGTPLLVTVPFSEFCERDTEGNPKGSLVENCNAVTSFGVWVNAIGDSEAVVDGMVDGTIYYDKFTAVQSEETAPVFEPVTK